MIGGALNFTLGLQANQFLNTLNVSSGKLIGFLGVANGIRAAFDKMWNAVQQGGKLTDLAAAAGVTVKEFYQLQFAFEQIGASADSVGGVIQRLRANLASGNQDDLLSQLGLNPDQLKNLGATDQIEKVSNALTKLNATSRAGAAQSIFGREGAAVAQMIANSGNDFATALKKSESMAQVWQRVAYFFDGLADKVAEISARIQTVWAQFTGAIALSIQEGGIAELLTDVIVSGFQAGLAAVPGMFLKLGEVLLRSFQVPLAYLKTGLDDIINSFLQGSRVDPKVARYLREQGFEPDESRLNLGGSTFQERLQENIALNALAMEEISAFANDVLKDGFGSAQEILSGLGERMNSLLDRLPQGQNQQQVSRATEGASATKPSVTDVTSLEKMGFVFAGLGRGFGGDDSRRTADNTRRLVQLAEQTNQLLEQQSNSSFANI